MTPSYAESTMPDNRPLPGHEFSADVVEPVLPPMPRALRDEPWRYYVIVSRPDGSNECLSHTRNVEYALAMVGILAECAPELPVALYASPLAYGSGIRCLLRVTGESWKAVRNGD